MTKSKAKTLMVTGAAAGIGAAIVRAAVAQGHRVLATDIDLAGARALAAEYPEQITTARLDVTSPEEWERALDCAWSEFGRLDVLVNNAGIAVPGNVLSVPLDGHQQTFDVNFFGPVRGMLAALPRFKRQGSGHLVTICSMSSYLPFPGLGSYAASKHALRAFHLALAIEERDGPITFTIAHPTATETAMLDHEAQFDDVALAFTGTSVSAEQVAEAVLIAIKKGTVEIFIPQERGHAVRKIGINPKSILKMVVDGQDLGRQKLQARRATKGGGRG